ncbi:hypothetical protein JOE27_002157 [Pseudomonas sp. M5]|nr:hypothetical protein [Pseudomonas sp. M5]
MTKSADERLHQKVQEAWRRKAEAAIAEAGVDSNAVQGTLATELKARLMAEYRDELDRQEARS